MRHRVPLFIITAALLLTVIIVLSFWAQGYTLDRQSGRLEKTGMILVKSQPDGAKIFVDDKLVSATNATLAALKPGRHRVRLEKEGYAAWRKDLPVQTDLVTEVNAVLIPLTPKLLPLTVNGIHAPTLAHDGQRLAFFSPQNATPGLWFLNLNERHLFNLTRPVPKMLLADTPNTGYSRGTSLAWSPDDSEILLTMNKQGYYLLDTTTLPVLGATATASATPTLARWQENEEKNRLAVMEKARLPEALKEVVLQEKTLFSPNGQRFLYQKINGQKNEYHVYDLSDPLPVGGREDYLTLTVSPKDNLKVFWYSDSRHLLLFSCQQTVNKNALTNENVGQCREGTVELTDIDGTNRTQIYRGAVADDSLFPSPDGSEIIISTSFNQEAEPNLYAISLR